MEKMKYENMSRLEAIKAAQKCHTLGSNPPATIPKQLRLSTIECVPVLFQFRDPSQFDSKAHVKALTKTVKEGKTLEALTVWWSGDGWYLVDGHHRWGAYQAAKWPADRAVPVTVHKGGLMKALMTSVTHNTKDKLSMSTREKTQAAWEFVTVAKIEDASVADISNSFGVSDRMVKYMRSVKRTLTALDAKEDLSRLPWLQARARAAGVEASGEGKDWEQWAKDEADRYEELLQQAVGHVQDKQREALVTAFCRIVPRGFIAEVLGLLEPETDPKADF